MMEGAFVGNELARLRSSNSRGTSWRSSQSIMEVLGGQRDDFFMKNYSTRWREMAEEEEKELKWAAIDRLPTYDRMRKGMMKEVIGNGRVVHHEVDMTNLGNQDRKVLMESILKVVEDDNEKFLRRLRNRTDR